MTKKITVTLPKGTLVYPKLNKVDEFKGKRRFITRIKFDDENHRKVDAWLKKAAKELGAPEGTKLPWKKDKKTGELTIQATSGEKYPPALLDAKGKEIPRAKVEVGGGTVAKCEVNCELLRWLRRRHQPLPRLRPDPRTEEARLQRSGRGRLRLRGRWLGRG
jgi:hypothetical protein